MKHINHLFEVTEMVLHNRCYHLTKFGFCAAFDTHGSADFVVYRPADPLCFNDLWVCMELCWKDLDALLTFSHRIRGGTATQLIVNRCSQVLILHRNRSCIVI